MKQLNNNYLSKRKRLLCVAMLTGLASLSFKVEAQFITSTSAQTSYPTTGTTALNLDIANTKFLSNFSFPGNGPLTGYTIEIAGWSTDNDGGFTYGKSLTTFPYSYTGDGSLAIPNAKEVQVGYLEFSGLRYIVASYYDVAVQKYGYDLYSYMFTPPSTTAVTKLYTYHFDHIMRVPTYVDLTTSLPGPPPGPSPVRYTMGYNRISMDIDKDAEKVAIVLTDAVDSRMYLAAGQIGVDTITFSPALPGRGTPTYIAPALLYYAVPTYAYPATPGTGTWVPNGSDFDAFDASTGLYLRYYTGTNELHYSYYPIDMGRDISIFDNTTGILIAHQSWSAQEYSPLINIKAVAQVAVPGTTEYFNQLWPDVCFADETITFVTYINNPDPGIHPITLKPNGAEDLYVGSYNFNDAYSYTGATYYSSLPGDLEGQNSLGVTFVNTADNRSLRMSPTGYINSFSGWCSFDEQSLCKSLPLLPAEEMRANIDAPDNLSYTYAITFAYTVPSGGYTAYYPKEVWDASYGSCGACFEPHPAGLTEIIHNAAESGKHNIYVRYGQQAILTNTGLVSSPPGAHVAINGQQNINPRISFNPNSNTGFMVAWVSEQAGVSGNPWSYVGVEIEVAAPGGYGAPGYRVNPSSYLRLPNSPSLANDNGRHPLVSLSKHQDGLSRLYSVFTAEDAIPTYTVQHQNHNWSAPSTWKTTPGIADLPQSELSVGPNPFESSLHINSSKNVSANLTDITGKKIISTEGAVADVNTKLDAVANSLTPGAYLLNVKEEGSNPRMFKVTKK